MHIKDLKTKVEAKADSYQLAKDEAFTEQFNDFISGYALDDKAINPMSEDDLQGFIDSFTFPDEADWCLDEVLSDIDTAEDAKYQLQKDEGL